MIKFSYNILILLLITSLSFCGYNVGQIISLSDQQIMMEICSGDEPNFETDQQMSLYDYNGEYNGGHHYVFFISLNSTWCDPCYSAALAMDDIESTWDEQLDKNVLIHTSLAYIDNPYSCSEWASLGTYANNLITNDNDHQIYNTYNTFYSIPEGIFIDHNMQIYHLTQGFPSSYIVNTKINEMLENCGELCERAEYGCTSAQACNHNESAIIDDGSCIYPEEDLGCDCYNEAGNNMCDDLGCMDPDACNYEPLAVEEDGSCEYVLDCAQECGGNAVVDACGECNGNGYDTCDDDNDGVTNFDQWGYGPYNLVLSDNPYDSGGWLILTFNKSFYEQGSWYDSYRAQRLEDGAWNDLQVMQANDGYDLGDDDDNTYTTWVETLNDNEETWFRVVYEQSLGIGMGSNFHFSEIEVGISLSNYGCTDEIACNYDPNAGIDDGTCEYPEENFDCSGNCLIEIDCAGECGGDTVVDECGECGGDGPGEYFDCSGNCLLEECSECEPGSVWLFRHCNNFWDGHSDGCLLPSGCFSIEETTFIDLSYESELEGLEISPLIGSLINLVSLDLSNSDITGNIPPEIGNLINLEELYIRGSSSSNSPHHMTGNIPPEIGNLVNLKELNLTSQHFQNFPSEIGNLVNLEELNLTNNQIEGPIPSEIGNLTQLTGLHLPRNYLYGSLPIGIGNLTNLQFLDLWANDISGEILLEIGNLVNLTYLNLSSNLFTGEIPLSIENLINIETLYLDGNELNGPIPLALTNLVNLATLGLGHNNLSGTIPYGFGNIPDLYYLSLHDNQLSGVIPDDFCDTYAFSVNNIELENNELCPDYPECFTSDYIGEQETINCCDGNGLDEGICDCNGNLWNCANVCADTALDECGECGGDGPDEGFDCDGNVLSNETATPVDFGISNVYPNPFNPTTNITYHVPKHAKVDIDVYNMSGQRVESLYSGLSNPGVYTLIWNASGVTSGMYMIQMTSGSFIKTQKVILLK